MLTLKGRNEEKVRFSADHLKRALDKVIADLKGVIVKGPAPAPLLRAESFYRYQLTLLARQMSVLSSKLAELSQTLSLPDDVSLSIDIDPADLG